MTSKKKKKKRLTNWEKEKKTTVYLEGLVRFFFLENKVPILPGKLFFFYMFFFSLVIKYFLVYSPPLLAFVTEFSDET